MTAADQRGEGPSPSRRYRFLSPRARYVAFTFAFIALVAVLIVLGQLLLLTLLLLACMVFAPRIVDVVTQSRGDAILFGPCEEQDDRADMP